MSATLKPRFDPLLWSQLRPSVISTHKAVGEDAGQTLSTGYVPLVPENKIATSLRVVLHDTKSVLEQFSDKLSDLLGGMDNTRRRIDETNHNLENAQEKVLEELVDTVNRCQKGLLEVLDAPAQASVLNEVKSSQTETVKKLEQLGFRVDLVQNSLQCISEQQGQILTCLTSLTPMATFLQEISQQLHHIVSQLSLMQSLYQGLPDQFKFVQHETSAQNIQAIHDAFSTSFFTSMNKFFDSLNRVVLESTKLVTTTTAGSWNASQEPAAAHNRRHTATGSEPSNRPITRCSDQDAAIMTKPQFERGVMNSSSSLSESGGATQRFPGSQETRNHQKSFKKQSLASSIARNKTLKGSVTKKRPNAKPRKVHSSDRILRSRMPQSKPTIPSPSDNAASSLRASLSSVNSADRTLRSSPAHISSPAIPAPRRRMLLPSSFDPDQQIDFGIDWDQILS